MQDDVAEASPQYWAFISYSHKDAAFGRQLHRQLEGYILPRRLVGRATPRGAAPRRLAPVFRDREEFAAAHDLSAEVRAALKASRSLVIVCSPSAAASTWVSREVEVFRELHPERPVLAAIRAGEPPACFPSALRRSRSGKDVEPLAADFRRDRDGVRLGLLKLVAGIAGIGLDELVQRDAHRRNQRVMAVTAGALLVALVMGMSAIYALDARREAERQRGQAEGLVEFMLTDLRDKLKGVGRLDVMTAVNERALNYYGGQDLTRLPVGSLERRARILHAMGEDDETRGDHRAALDKFQEARRVTAALLADAPDDPELIFDHAQSEYWIGLLDYDQKRFPAAKISLVAYKHLAERLVAMAPGSTRYRLQLGEADSDLCAVTLDGHTDSAAAAIGFCTEALAQTEAATRHAPMTADVAANIVDRHAWLADAYSADGQFARAKSERLVQERILNQQMAADPNNRDLKDTWIVLQRALASLDARTGDEQAARTRLTRALAASDEMVKFDPANKPWAQLHSDLLREARKLRKSSDKESLQ